LKVAKCLNV